MKDIILLLLVIIPSVVGCDRAVIANNIVKFHLALDDYITTGNGLDIISSYFSANASSWTRKNEGKHTGVIFPGASGRGRKWITNQYKAMAMEEYNGFSHHTLSTITSEEVSGFCVSSGSYQQIVKYKYRNVGKYTSVILGRFDIDWLLSDDDTYKINRYHISERGIGTFKFPNINENDEL